jgi:hypothetical protein
VRVSLYGFYCWCPINCHIENGVVDEPTVNTCKRGTKGRLYSTLSSLARTLVDVAGCSHWLHLVKLSFEVLFALQPSWWRRYQICRRISTWFEKANFPWKSWEKKGYYVEFYVHAVQTHSRFLPRVSFHETHNLKSRQNHRFSARSHNFVQCTAPPNTQQW